MGVFCAIKGYALFAKKESLKGVIIASVLALAVLVFAWYLCIGYAYYLDVSTVEPNASLFDYLFNGFDYFDLADAVGHPEVRSNYITNLITGIVFSVLVCGSYIAQAFRNSKAASSAAPAQPTLNGENEENK